MFVIYLPLQEYEVIMPLECLQGIKNGKNVFKNY